MNDRLALGESDTHGVPNDGFAKRSTHATIRRSTGLRCLTSGKSLPKRPCHRRPRLSSPVRKNILLCRIFGLSYIAPCPAPPKGRCATSTTRGGMRWTLRVLQDEGTRGGRKSRVGLAPRRWCQVRERKLSWATVANKPGAPGRAR